MKQRVACVLIILLCMGGGWFSLGKANADATGDLKKELRQSIHRVTDSNRLRATPLVRGSGSAEGAVYHNATTLICSDCHVMHGLSDGSAFTKLLKRETALALCLTCHDGRAGIPDVVGPDTNSLTDRSAGFFATPGQNINGHNLGPGATDLCSRCHFGGDQLTAEVTCIECHDPHGNGKPRNLQWASWPEGTPMLGLLINPAASGLDRYEAANIAYGTDGTENLREVTNMCIDCHHVFSGAFYTDADGDGKFERHPVTETERGVSMPVSFGDALDETDSAHWLDGTGSGFDVPRLRFLVNPATDFTSASIVATDNEVFCLTCHKAHGSDHPFGLIWQNPTIGAGPSGCNQCHNK